MKLLATITLSLTIIATASARARSNEFNYDEAKVPSFNLPDPLVSASGKPIKDAEAWRAVRRPEILKLFQDEVYGRSPQPRKEMSFEVTESSSGALSGKAVRKQVTIYFSADKQGPRMDLLLYLPADATGPVPAFVGLNFNGIHTVHTDPAIKITKNWVRSGKGAVDHQATEEGRGASASKWAIETIVERGYALGTVYYGDIDPDYHDEFQNGVHPLFYEAGQNAPQPDEWGSIAAWAWGLSRVLDYFETDDDIDDKHVAVMGHSRLGKTALWAGARDERFALVISNNSGCGGAALSRRRFGETVKRINTSFPHWFCDNFVKYNDNEDKLPVDQHMLVALIAPRPVYIASAKEDRWADPRGEFLSGFHADAVYKLLGTDGIGDAKQQPSVDKPVMHTIGYHIRRGAHDVTDFDWKAYLDFADKHFRP